MVLEEQGKAGKSNRFRILSLSKEQNMRGSAINHQTRGSGNSWKYKQNYSLSLLKREFPRSLRGLQKGGGGGGKFTRNSVPINGRAGSLCTRHLVEVHLCDTIPSWQWKRHNVGSRGPKACGAGFFKLSGQEPHHALRPCQSQSRGSLALSGSQKKPPVPAEASEGDRLGT